MAGPPGIKDIGLVATFTSYLKLLSVGNFQHLILEAHVETFNKK